MNMTRLWLPLVLGVAAALGNYLVLRSATSTHELLALKSDLKPGQVVTEDCLRRVSVQGEESLWQGTIRADQVAAILGKPVRRHIKAGEILFQADIDLPAYQIQSHLLPPGYQTLTLTARRSALASQPVASNHVKVTIRSNVSDQGIANYDSYLFLGWYQEPGKNGTVDPDAVVRFAIAVPIKPDGHDQRLRDLQYSNLSDRVIAVEVVNTTYAQAPTPR